jgi:hypothetical protein
MIENTAKKDKHQFLPGKFLMLALILLAFKGMEKVCTFMPFGNRSG